MEVLVEYGAAVLKEFDSDPADCCVPCTFHDYTKDKNKKFLQRLVFFRIIDEQTSNRLIQEGQNVRHIVTLIGSNNKIKTPATSMISVSQSIQNWTNKSLLTGRKSKLNERGIIIMFSILICIQIYAIYIYTNLHTDYHILYIIYTYKIYIYTQKRSMDESKTSWFTFS